MKYRYIVGVDEVGRGPIAGPVTVGAVCISADFDMRFFAGIKDSKKLSAQKRRAWRDTVLLFKKNNAKRLDLAFTISSVGPFVIDRIGINGAIARAIKQCLTRLAISPEECLVLLDGGLRAPREFINQKTIVKGDEKEPVIALASILAKVHRDTKMERFSEHFSGYGFEQHKGYGTDVHMKNIQRLGLCSVHRKTFLHRL